MISRKASRLIAELYEVEFAPLQTAKMSQFGPQKANWSELYPFLYDRDYDPAFLGWLEKQIRSLTPLRDFIMRIHTGESLNAINVNLPSEARNAKSQALLMMLARDVISRVEGRARPPRKEVDPEASAIAQKAAEMLNTFYQTPFELVEQLKAQLEIDGYIYRDGRLLFFESTVVPVEEEQVYLKELVNQLPVQNKEVIINHLDLSDEHFVEGRYSDSIANARNFYEEIQSQVVKYIHKEKGLSSKIPGTALGQRDFLFNHGFLDDKEKEAIEKVYGFISDRGSHPYIAERDEARLMRHIALSFSQYVLLKLQKHISA